MSVSGFPSVDQLQLLLSRALQEGAARTTLERIEWLLFYRTNGESVAATCRTFGIARGTFYRVVHALNVNDWRTLALQSRRPKTLSVTHLPQDVVDLVRIHRRMFPLEGKEAIRLRLLTEHGLSVSASAIGRLITREKLFFADSLLHERKRGDVETAVSDALPYISQPFEDIPAPQTPVVQMWKRCVAGVVLSLTILLAGFAFGIRQGSDNRVLDQSTLHGAATGSGSDIKSFCAPQDSPSELP